MNIVGTSPDNHIVEMIEIAGHPFYVGTQAHPEFKSRPNHAPVSYTHLDVYKRQEPEDKYT